MKVKLVIVSPEVQPNEYDIALPTKIGRGHEATLKLVHPLVSRLHCELFAEGERVMIRDLDSLNGTFVDQQRIDEDTAIASGVTVMMGTVMFRLVFGPEADRLPPPGAKMDKTVAAAGTVRKETLAKIANRPDNGVEPTVVTPDEESLGLAFLDDEADAESPKPADPVKPRQAAAPKPAVPPPAGKTAPAKASAQAPAKPAAPAKTPDDSTQKTQKGGQSGGEDDDPDDFFESLA